MIVRSVIWWLGYFVLALWLQKFVPGVDALAAGVILCLQRGSNQQVAIFCFIAMIVQEGTGTLPFGSSILWYGFIILCYYLGIWFFMGKNLVFICMLSLGLGLGRICIIAGMDMLQHFPFDNRQLLFEAVAQTLLTPMLWWFAVNTRNRFVYDAH